MLTLEARSDSRHTGVSVSAFDDAILCYMMLAAFLLLDAVVERSVFAQVACKSTECAVCPVDGAERVM